MAHVTIVKNRCSWFLWLVYSPLSLTLSKTGRYGVYRSINESMVLLGTEGLMLNELHPGAEVEHNGSAIGSVERVLDDQVLVRHGRADYLLRIPERYLTVESPERARLDDTFKLDEVEQMAIDSGRAPPSGEHITDAGPTDPSPSPEGVAGRSHGMPLTFDGPATG